MASLQGSKFRAKENRGWGSGGWGRGKGCSHVQKKVRGVKVCSLECGTFRDGSIQSVLAAGDSEMVANSLICNKGDKLIEVRNFGFF